MKKSLLAIFISLFAMHSMAQIKDVTFTVSPVAEYIWWDANTTLTNTPLWGVRAGFGLGPIFEVRAFYQKSFDVKSSLRQLDWQTTTDWAENMKQSNVNIIRKGGEIKINLVPNVFFSPYLTAGGGIQTLKYSLDNPLNTSELITRKEDQLFGSLGLGTKFNLSKRVVFSLEGRGTFFNVNSGSDYIKSSVEFNDANSKLMKNWSLLASLDFYLGGVNDKNAGDVSSAYNKMFADGFRGVKFVLEPGVVFLDANSKSDFSDQFFIGGAAGLDFSSLVGIRGFYYSATKNPTKLSFDINKDLSMYGGYFLFRLNQPRGVTPYLTLGAGYLNVKEGYRQESNNLNANSTIFGSAGLGIEVPLSKYFALYGAYNLMFIPQQGVKADNVQDPSQIRVNPMYNAGVRINFGASSNANEVYKRNVNQALMLENTKNEDKIEELKSEYQTRIDALTKELDKANKNNDINRASEILQEKKQTEQILNQIQQNNQGIDNASNAKLIRINSDDFEILVNRILEEIKRTNAKGATSSRADLSPLETRLLQELSAQNQSSAKTASVAASTSKDDAIVKELSEISQKLDRNFTQSINNAQKQAETIVISDKAHAQPTAGAAPIIVESSQAKKDKKTLSYSKVNRLSLLAGAGFGDAFTASFGVRGYMQIAETSFDFVPQVDFSLGTKNGFGLSGNVVYNFDASFSSFINPYAGVGLGLSTGKKTVFGPKVIVGTFLNVGKGNLFVDYSFHNLFKRNQLLIGYQFSF